MADSPLRTHLTRVMTSSCPSLHICVFVHSAHTPRYIRLFVGYRILSGVRGDLMNTCGRWMHAACSACELDGNERQRCLFWCSSTQAMEQQTISIAKAGITTMLKSRTSVLAAANPPSGKYDDLKTAQENIDLQTTILSRFDLIFIVKDERSVRRLHQHPVVAWCPLTRAASVLESGPALVLTA